MATQESVLTMLNKWHTFKFRPDDVPLVSAAKAARLGKAEEVFVAPAEGGKWICRHKDTGKPAIFTFAVLWAYNGNLRTGSYVPPGETIPKQTFLKTLKREPSYMCDIAYGFDVTIDKEIYNCIQAMEDCVQRNSNFNMTKKSRAEYQAAPDDIVTCYQVKHRLFIRCNPSQHQILTPEEHPDVHPWLLDASNNSKDKLLILNVPLPSYYEYRGGNEIVNLFDSAPPNFCKGDIVIMTFRLGFYVTSRHWASEILPEEFIRVYKVHSQYDNTYTQMNWEKPDVQRRLVPGQLHAPAMEPIAESTEESQIDPETKGDATMSPPSSISPKSVLSSASSMESLKRNLSAASIRRRESEAVLEKQLAEAMESDELEDAVMVEKSVQQDHKKDVTKGETKESRKGRRR